MISLKLPALSSEYIRIGRNGLILNLAYMYAQCMLD